MACGKTSKEFEVDDSYIQRGGKRIEASLMGKDKHDEAEIFDSYLRGLRNGPRTMNCALRHDAGWCNYSLTTSLNKST